MTTYVAIPPAAVLPADGKASKLRINNKNASNGDIGYAQFGFDVGNNFSLNIPNEGAFSIGAPLKIMSTLTASFATFKTFFQWLDDYKQQAVTAAQVFIGEEKTRAEDAEGVLEQAISDEKTRAEDAEGDLQSAIDANTTAIANIINGSPEHLNQLKELVADYTANGQTVTTALQTEATYARAEAADLRTRVAALETLIADLIQQPQ